MLDAIRRVQSRHNAMEFFGARPGRPIDVCLEEVGKSDLLVVIVGLKYGSLPPEMGISYSQAEYEEGARLEKPCLVYLRDDEVPILPKYVERDPDKLRLLDAWKQALNANHTVAKFETWPKLAVQVAADIGNILLVRATAEAKGVAEAPLREVLKRLGETEVAEAEIPDRLTKAADELLRLRADLARLSNDRPEFAAIRARASALIDKGDFDAARGALNEGRERARALREEASRTEAAADEASTACNSTTTRLRHSPKRRASTTTRLATPHDRCLRPEDSPRRAPPEVATIVSAMNASRSAAPAVSPFPTASRSPTAWRNPIPATPSGNMISASVTRSATCRSPKATSPGADPYSASRSHRPPGAFRSRQRRLAARSLGILREDGRRAGGARRPRRRADLLPRQPRDQQTAWRNPIPATPAGGAISQCLTTRSATCRSRRATSPGR